MKSPDAGTNLVTVPLLASGHVEGAARLAGVLARDHEYAVRLVATHPPLKPRVPDALVRYLTMRSEALAGLDRATRLVRETAGADSAVEAVLARGPMSAHLESAARGSTLIAVQSDGEPIGGPAFVRMIGRAPYPVVMVPADWDADQVDPSSMRWGRVGAASRMLLGTGS